MYPIIKKTEFPSLWAHGASDRAVIRDQVDFLTTLWEPQIRVSPDLFGAFCFKRRGSTKMVQEFEWLSEDVKIGRLLRKYDRHKWRSEERRVGEGCCGRGGSRSWEY